MIMETLKNKNPPSNTGCTPLHNAATKGNIDVCKLILDNVSNKNPKDKKKVTPLHDAAAVGHLDICKLIIDLAGDKNPGDIIGMDEYFLGNQKFSNTQIFFCKGYII